MTAPNPTFDTILASNTDILYTNTNGSSDFALFDSDLNGYCLSYHGGEIRRSATLFMGDTCSITMDSASGNFSKKIEIHQKTKLVNNKLEIDTSHIVFDGGYKLDVKVVGNINTSAFYTFANTTNPAFGTVYTPKILHLTGTSEDLHESLGDKSCGKIIQGNGTRSVESRFTIFKDSTFVDNGIPGPYIRKHSSYLKPYYGWHKGAPKNLTELSFTSVRLYS